MATSRDLCVENEIGVMTERVDKRGRILVLAVFDVSRTHFYGVCERDVYVEPLAELHRSCGDAQQDDVRNARQKLWGEHLRNNGFEFGASNLAFFRSEFVNGFSHRDNFVTAAEDQIEVFGKLLQEKFVTRRIGVIGAAKHF